MLDEEDILMLFFGKWWSDLDEGSPEEVGSKNNQEMVNKMYGITKSLFKILIDISKTPGHQEELNLLKNNPRNITDKVLKVILDTEKEDLSGENIFTALLKTDRRIFIPYLNKKESYYNKPIGIGKSQTCSAPYIVASYNLLSKIVSNPKRIFEVGTGCGYQISNFAVLYPEAELFGIDIHQSLCESAIKNIKKVDEMNKSDLSQRIKIEQGNALKLEENNLFKENAPYDIISFAFMLPEKYNLKDLDKYLNNDGIVIAPIHEEIHGNKDPSVGYLNLMYKTMEKEILSSKVASVLFVPAITA